MKSARLSSRHKSSASLIVLQTILTWPKQGVSNSKANRAKGPNPSYLRCQWKLCLIISFKMDDPQVSYFCAVSNRPIWDLQVPWGVFFFLIWSPGVKAALHVIDGRALLLPCTQRRVSTTSWSLNSSCILLALDNTTVMKVRSFAHSRPVSARPTVWPQSPKQYCILCS